MAQISLLLDGNQELQATATGGFLVGNVDNNLMKYICMACPGHWKMSPELGPNLYKYSNTSSPGAKIERDIRKHLEADVFVRPAIDVSAFPTIYVNKLQMNVG